MIIDKNFSPLMEQIFAGRLFSQEEVEALIQGMISGTLSDVRISAVLTAFRFIDLTPQLVFSAVQKIQETDDSQAFENTYPHLVDCSGTGGDSVSTINISTASAFVAAAAGATIAKFAGKSVSGKGGSRDVLHMLNVHCTSSIVETEEMLEQNGLAFLNASSFYPALKDLLGVRKTLGFKTILDVIDPLLNPAPLTGQLVGVYHKDVLPIVAECLKGLNRTRALVVYGEEGLDEISVCGPTQVCRLEKQKIESFVWKPSDFGFPVYSISDLKGADAQSNAQALLGILNGNANAAMRDAVTLNAAGVLWCAEKCSSLQEGIQLAKNVLSSGAALKQLEKLKK